MQNHQAMKTTDGQISSDDESTVAKSLDGTDKCDTSNQQEDDFPLDHAMEDELTDDDDDDDRSFVNYTETYPESMDEESDNVSYDLEHQQNEAMEKLSTIFQLMNIAPIHDK